MDFKAELIRKIKDRSATVAIIGQGYVGLPLAVSLGNEGFNVLGVDVDPAKVEALNRGVSHIGDVPSEMLKVLVDAGRYEATTDYSRLQQVDTISICVPTPLRKTRDPDMSYVVQATEGIATNLREGQLVVLESTTYPGTTEEVIIPRLTEATGYTLGENLFVAFSPERIDPANQVYGVRNTPRVVGGATAACSEVAKTFYETVVDTVVAVSSTQTAEMVKLLENTFRAVNIGLVNEIAIMCDKLGVNVWEVIDAAKTKPFGFMAFYPGPGLGGHCIPIDPLYLSWKLKSLNYNARFIELADEINTNMPRYVVSKVAEALNTERKAINGSKVLVLGAAYKPDVADVRESPALDIIQLLQQRGAEVSYHDPYVGKIWFDEGDMYSVDYSTELLSSTDCVVIVTNHAAFDYAEVLSHARLVVDTRNATGALRRAGEYPAHVTEL